MSTGIDALVLAGRRSGETDPVARVAGVSHKALVDIAGRAMISHVLEALREADGVDDITIVTDVPQAIHAHPDAAAVLARCDARVFQGAAQPSMSVAEALRGRQDALLVTTADNPLLTARMIEHFLRCTPERADVAMGVATRECVTASFPHVERTYLRLADGTFSGCNLFLLRPPRAEAVVSFWKQIEGQRKKVARVAALLGPVVLARYLAGRLSRRHVLDRIEKLTGARAAFVQMPFAEAAIDVDRERDLALVRAILEERGGGPSSRL